MRAGFAGVKDVDAIPGIATHIENLVAYVFFGQRADLGGRYRGGVTLPGRHVTQRPSHGISFLRREKRKNESHAGRHPGHFHTAWQVLGRNQQHQLLYILELSSVCLRITSCHDVDDVHHQGHIDRRLQFPQLEEQADSWDIGLGGLAGHVGRVGPHRRRGHLVLACRARHPDQARANPHRSALFVQHLPLL
ncbi:hypothetical protein D3C87_1519220 [compost metagenome]